MSEAPAPALEISGDSLEDLLAFDDLFLDYFNCFLALPVFPQALIYNRLTGAFDEVDSPRLELVDSLPTISPSVQYGPTDAEREKMLEWAKEERLPLFLRTQLFRELKLVKLLLRPLEMERQSASRDSSRNIRGYSRATESYISSLSVGGDNNGNDVNDFDDIWGELHYSALYQYQRPGSRALSLPAKVVVDSQSYDLPFSMGSTTTKSAGHSSSLGLSAIKSRKFRWKSPEKASDSYPSQPTTARLLSHGQTSETARQRTRISNRVEVIAEKTRLGESGDTSDSTSKSSERSKAPLSSVEEEFLRGARAQSAPVNYEQYLRMPRLNTRDFDTLFGETEPETVGPAFVQFDGEGNSEEQTESDMRTMEGRLQMTVQQVKENVLGSYKGFEEFREFLRNTAGQHLLDFWLECEKFKDTMEDFDEVENMEKRNAYFRDIQDKFKLKLTPDAVDQITRAASNMGLSHTIFLRTQYDVLRRLRAYWVPRFLIHYEMTRNINVYDEDEASQTPSALATQPLKSNAIEQAFRTSSECNDLPFFPYISLVHSLPVMPEDVRDYASNLTIHGKNTNSSDSWYRMFSNQNSSMSAKSSRLSCSTKRSAQKRFLMALAADRLAGGPFERYLTELKDAQLLASLLFWEDVTEYRATEDHSTDRLLRLCQAWNIYRKYLAEDSPHRIELPEDERNGLQRKLSKARDSLEASIFDSARNVVVEKLEQTWVRYLKEDLKKFLDCRVKLGVESPPSTAEAIEITLSEYDLIIKRPRPWIKRIPGSTASERARRLNEALLLADDIDDERRAQKKAEALARRKEVEKERRKIVRAAYARLREAKKKPTSGSSTIKLYEDIAEIDNEEEGKGKANQVPTYQEMTGNRQIMSMFRNFVNESEKKDTENLMHLYHDVETYFNLKDNKAKKSAQAAYIAKTYINPEGKKHTPINNKLMAQLKQEKERPKSGLLRQLQKTVLPKVEEVFKEFVEKQADEFNVTPSNLITMPQSELAVHMDNDQVMMSNWNNRRSPRKSIQHNLPGPGGTEPYLPPLFQLQVNTAGDRSHRTSSGQDYANYQGSYPLHGDRRKQSDQTLTPLLSSSSSSHPSTASSSKPQTTGRAQPTRDDKNEFLSALDFCAMGHMTVPMLYFYKYLLKHGKDDGMPQIDKDLFFYIEVQKFKDGSHNHADEEMLKRKVQSIGDCFLDSVYLPTLQIDIPLEVHQKSMKAAQRYLSGKETLSSLFDEAQVHVFKELLFYWAGYKRAILAPEDLRRRPVTKYDKMLRRRLEKIQNYQIPSSDFNLPAIPEGAIPAFTISLSEGVKFKEIGDSNGGTPQPNLSQRESTSSKVTVMGLDNYAARSRGQSRRESIVTT